MLKTNPNRIRLQMLNAAEKDLHKIRRRYLLKHVLHAPDHNMDFREEQYGDNELILNTHTHTQRGR